MERGYWGHYLTTETRALWRAAAGVDHFSLDTRSCLHLQSLTHKRRQVDSLEPSKRVDHIKLSGAYSSELGSNRILFSGVKFVNGVVSFGGSRRI